MHRYADKIGHGIAIVHNTCTELEWDRDELRLYI